MTERMSMLSIGYADDGTVAIKIENTDKYEQNIHIMSFFVSADKVDKIITELQEAKKNALIAKQEKEKANVGKSE